MLRVLRAFRPHRLTEPEEQILTQKAVHRARWSVGGGLLEGARSRDIEIDLDGDQLALPEADRPDVVG